MNVQCYHCRWPFVGAVLIVYDAVPKFFCSLGCRSEWFAGLALVSQSGKE